MSTVRYIVPARPLSIGQAVGSEGLGKVRGDDDNSSNGGKREAATHMPRSLPNPLPPVPALNPELVPRSLRPWIEDTAEALQVPLEFCAVPAIVGIAGVIGRQVGIALKQRDTWVERCIIWGALVGRPSTGKSPAIRPMQRMLSRLEQRRRADWLQQEDDFSLNAELLKEKRLVAKQLAQRALRKGDQVEARRALGSVAKEANLAEEPRIVVNDATVEKLGELLNANPRGLVQVRDELASWLSSLDREGREGDRGFWLECWNGNGPFACDRIGRGTVRIEAPAVSIIGGVQPGKLVEHVRNTVRGGNGDDGLLQRFQLAVYPDVPASWRYVDRARSPRAEADAWNVFERLDALDLDALGAERADSEDIPFFRLSDSAQDMFVEWQTALMLRLRQGDEPPHIESHLSKFPALAGRLALIFHLADGADGTVQKESMDMALGWCEFLEGHARRIYQSGVDGGLVVAHQLLKKRRALQEQFTAREIYRKGWAGMDRASVDSAIDILEEFGYLSVSEVETGGRPSKVLSWRND